jgi:hypothetical protein
LVRACSIPNIHFTATPAAFLSAVHAFTSVASVTRSGMRRARHWLASTPISISTMLSQLACFGT